MPCTTRVKEFFDFYQKLDKNSTSDLASFYDEAIVFIDPLHRVEGLPALIAYFDRLYARVSEIDFEFAEPDTSGDRVWCTWVMTYRHPKINRGQPVKVEGASRLDWKQDKVVCHRDFFDAGQMLWEQLPLLGSILALLKKRATG
ncbi:SnoaL-like domain-containing protein [Marinospirillum celere]|uniref:SnoaL-like domain-containing protein n=1 Tax=Marinospirillum celere TaxID=1122252 RepID=A0A1I1I519_9GAMM|nr:nuclear transport factor 2 family protein [Marinospirillum celere]SFC31256.1 SnoaL-like domain-containing protein [Marinospirillum celere]